MELNKSYSNKSNALRAARKNPEMNQDTLFAYELNGKWTVRDNVEAVEEVEVVEEVVAAPVPVKAEGLKAAHGFAGLALTLPSKPAPKAAPLTSRVKIEKDRDTQNGMSRPSIGGKCRQVWDKCDELTTTNGTPPAISQLMKIMLDIGGIRVNTIKSQYAYWRKFNGITGRIVEK